jgi:hypothetical protein
VSTRWACCGWEGLAGAGVEGGGVDKGGGGAVICPQDEEGKGSVGNPREGVESGGEGGWLWHERVRCEVWGAGQRRRQARVAEVGDGEGYKVGRRG